MGANSKACPTTMFKARYWIEGGWRYSGRWDFQKEGGFRHIDTIEIR